MYWSPRRSRRLPNPALPGALEAQCWGIPGKLEDLPAAAIHQADQMPEVGVEDGSQLLGAGRSPGRQPLGKRREPRDVGQEHRGRETLALGCIQRRRVGYPPPDDQLGQIAGDGFEQRLDRRISRRACGQASNT